MKYVFLVVSMIVILLGESYCQTCCTGGVPLLGTLRIPELEKTNFGINTSYVYNSNSTLIVNQELIKDHAFRRNVNTILFQADYGVGDFISVSAIVPYLIQSEQIEIGNEKNRLKNHGIGDASLWNTYKRSYGDLIYALSGGIKFPTGNTDQRDEDTNIALPLSFQNGSGSVDLGFIGFLALYLNAKKEFYWSNQISVKLNTRGKRFNAHPNYKFGSIFHINSAVNGSFVVGSKLLDVGTGLNYQYRTKDQFDGGYENENTGGQWINYFLGTEIGLSPKITISANAHVPLYRNVNGLQLTTSWILSVGLGYLIR